MSKKEKLRFLKLVMIYTLIMASIVTFGTLFICYRAGDISSGTVTALCGLWSIELSLSAWIKVSEGKDIKKKKDEEMSV